MANRELETKLAEKLGLEFIGDEPLLNVILRHHRVGDLLRECLSLMQGREWIKVTPETMPDAHTSWLIVWHNYGTGDVVEEAYWNGEHWRLERTNPCDEPIYLDEQVYAYTKIPDPPEREIGQLPKEGRE